MQIKERLSRKSKRKYRCPPPSSKSRWLVSSGNDVQWQRRCKIGHQKPGSYEQIHICAFLLTLDVSCRAFFILYPRCSFCVVVMTINRVSCTDVHLALASAVPPQCAPCRNKPSCQRRATVRCERIEGCAAVIRPT